VGSKNERPGRHGFAHLFEHIMYDGVEPDADFQTLTERIGERARSRLFEMCRVIKMPLVEDYRLRKQGA